MNVDSYKNAKDLFLSGDYSVDNYFEQNNCLLEHAYCRLLSGDIAEAKKAFLENADSDLRADWGAKLIQFIEGYVETPPSYFQIRNFLEIDLNLLIKAGQADYVENIINGADIFYSINPESYKFISRVMLFNDFTEIALHYLNKAKDKFFYDPEMHYMLANCYYKKGEYPKARKAIANCLSILPEYYPAKKLLKMLD